MIFTTITCAKYPRADQLRLLFTDTDSLAYAVQTDDIYRDMADDVASRYNFSEYPLDHPLYDTSNRKALGFFKDERNSVPLREFVQNATPFSVRVKWIRMYFNTLDL